MNSAEETDVRDISCVSRKGVLTKKDVFRWCIDAALVLKGEGRSDVFYYGPARNSKFCLMLAMDPEKSDYFQNQFGICLCRIPINSAPIPDIAIKVSFALLDTRDRLHYACDRIMRDSDRVYATFDSSIFEKHQLIFLRKNMLYINCAMDVEELICEDSQELKRTIVYYGEECGGSKDVVDDLATLLEQEKFSDVSLCTADKEFQVHRSILGARSPVFAAMFDHDTLEKVQNRVVIEDIDSDVLQQLLKFVYTGDTEELTPCTALSLLAAADKYSVPKLKKKCSVFLCSNLTTDMALGVLSIANLHQDENLKEAAVNIILNNAVQVMKTDDWLTFLKENSELANTIIIRLAMRK